MAKKKIRDERFNYSKEDGNLSVVKNSDLICHDCKFRIPERTDICMYFHQIKPGSVFYKNECDYKQEK